MKIASLKQQIQELKCQQEKTRSKWAWETLNGENPFSYVCDRGNHRGGIQKETLCRLGLQVEINEHVIVEEASAISFDGRVAAETVVHTTLADVEASWFGTSPELMCPEVKE
ncbi:hypothetical protein Tco_0745841 [Tanacetum coccineum]